MRRRKKINYNSIVKNKKLPILTLDTRWHEIFPDEVKTNKIKQLEHRVNQLLKEQGKMVNDIKDMKKLKKTLVSDIVVNMDFENDPSARAKGKKMDQNKRFINELNEKIDEASDRLSELPYRIRDANEDLLSECIENSYERILFNQEELANISDWIQKTREELKNKILAKHDMEVANELIYSYMHDVLGAEVIEVFDMTHKISKDKDSNSPLKKE